eukprot:2178022-Prymnesium_polylepis.1
MPLRLAAPTASLHAAPRPDRCTTPPPRPPPPSPSPSRPAHLPTFSRCPPAGPLTLIPHALHRTPPPFVLWQHSWGRRRTRRAGRMTQAQPLAQ